MAGGTGCLVDLLAARIIAAAVGQATALGRDRDGDGGDLLRAGWGAEVEIARIALGASANRRGRKGGEQQRERTINPADGHLLRSHLRRCPSSELRSCGRTASRSRAVRAPQ